jgi:hypothetical protein
MAGATLQETSRSAVSAALWSHQNDSPIGSTSVSANICAESIHAYAFLVASLISGVVYAE